MNITLLKDFFKSLFLFLNSYTQDSSFVAPIYSLIQLKHFYKILTDSRGHVYLKLTSCFRFEANQSPWLMGIMISSLINHVKLGHRCPANDCLLMVQAVSPPLAGLARLALLRSPLPASLKQLALGLNWAIFRCFSSTSIDDNNDDGGDSASDLIYKANSSKFINSSEILKDRLYEDGKTAIWMVHVWSKIIRLFLVK